MGFYDYTVPAPDGTEKSMKDFEGNVVARFEPTEKMDKVAEFVGSLI